ncbi:glutamine-hydrolyzing carbamoyl-phosphate synthase small subunit [Fodinisporobacter ferrooxydans]|uniref:Carbamoyl phosphate synthase small chain n=1 Tax=Fodinisporobacter ferrooxydans TaxID=2901836 RepID=A0ABY4CFJ9_9BACL|nr:glutamine-hydrolyzing carbamoyl-phosphate synthase small subunit [Alicyclobacillaceae bacterium MYW30-H2]
MKALLLLEDGTLFEGKGFGATGSQVGEVVFNTGMTGYQEVLTDPSYCGQIVTMTYPLIGNYGTNADDMEATLSFAKGFVVREACDMPSNWRNRKSLHDYLAHYGVIGIEGIDTRMLTKRIRTKGTLKGVIASGPNLSAEDAKSYLQQDLRTDQILQVTTKSPYRCPGSGRRVVVMDYGVKGGTIRSLINRDCDVIVLPANATLQDVLAWDPQGILLSNGPGNPDDIPFAAELVRELLGKIPIFGICMGHQVISLACGATAKRLTFGHRGANHPVKDLRNKRVYITSQNHGYVIDEASLRSTELELTHINLNDGTVEGVRHTRFPAFSVQYHPEARPGPDDSDYLFDEFMALIDQFWEGR